MKDAAELVAHLLKFRFKLYVEFELEAMSGGKKIYHSLSLKDGKVQKRPVKMLFY